MSLIPLRLSKSSKKHPLWCSEEMSVETSLVAELLKGRQTGCHCRESIFLSAFHQTAVGAFPPPAHQGLFLMSLSLHTWRMCVGVVEFKEQSRHTCHDYTSSQPPKAWNVNGCHCWFQILHRTFPPSVFFEDSWRSETRRCSLTLQCPYPCH